MPQCLRRIIAFVQRDVCEGSELLPLIRNWAKFTGSACSGPREHRLLAVGGRDAQGMMMAFRMRDERTLRARVRAAVIGALGPVLGVVAAIGATPSEAIAGPALLFEYESGTVLYAEDPDHQWHPASLTKIMTAYLAFTALKAGQLTPSQKLVVSEKANAQSPSKVGLPVGAEMTVETCVKALIIKSANDGAVMLAEAIGGSEEAFAVMMNDTARRLGMTRTHFVNANGLPAVEQVTTARDLAKLARAIIRDFPEHAALWSMVEMQIGKQRLRTHNGLLRTLEGADGLKTGFICDAGFNVVATATRGDRKLIAVVLGEVSARDRSVRAASLLDHGFQTYGWKVMFSPPTLDGLPVAPDAKLAASVRESVLSWNCNPSLRPKTLVKKPKAGAVAAKDKAGKSRSAAKTPVKAGADAEAVAIRRTPVAKSSAPIGKPASSASGQNGAAKKE